MQPCRLRPELLEIPPSVATFGPLRFPYGGGFYLRLIPMSATRWLLDRDLDRARTPIVYVHPWELDGHHDAAIESGRLHRFIGNYGASETWERLAELVRWYPTRTMDDLREELEAQGT